MDFADFLRTCAKKDGMPLKESTVDHYTGGLKAVSTDMMREKVITKPLQEMELFELDLAIELILRNQFFEKKDKKGKRMYRNALKYYRLYAANEFEAHNVEDDEVLKISNDQSLDATEREAIVKARIGQGIYRDKLLLKYSDGCIITHINVPDVLVASHIKPWSVSTNSERINEDNGFILSATYDRLFDRGLISFENSGKILLSKVISDDDAQKLEIGKGQRYDIKFNAQMNDYLSYHRDVIFIK